MGHRIVKILILLAAIILVGTILIWCLAAIQRKALVTDNKTSFSVSQSASTATWTRLESQEQALPVVHDQDLYIYSFVKKSLIPTRYHTFDAGGAAYLGSHGAQASPDARYILFPNKDDNETLYLLSSETLETRKITKGPVEYITDWSPDSRRFIYYIKTDSLGSRKVIDGMGLTILPWEKEEQFSHGDSPGFHVFDIETGEDIHLFPLGGVAAFVDAQHVLAVANEQKSEGGQNERFVIFDINDFSADYAAFPSPIAFGQGQYSFTHDGKHWAFSSSKNPTNDMSIIIAPFPSLTGDVVETSTWADVQGPKISPQGRHVAYFKDSMARLTRIWDAQNKKMIKEVEGRPLHWLDEDRLVVQDPNITKSSGPVAFVVYNLVTDKSEVIPLDSEVGAQ